MSSSHDVNLSRSLVLGVDYVVENGLWVFTHAYHLKRGYCCRNGCCYCPYEDRTEGAPIESPARLEPAGANEGCSSCGAKFRCCPGNCWCNEVSVPTQALAEMRQSFDRCLCKNCLEAVVSRFMSR